MCTKGNDIDAVAVMVVAAVAVVAVVAGASPNDKVGNAMK